MAPSAGQGHAAATQVSVICTAKNAAATIEGTIRSILAQDLASWEMIIVDDGSTDDTMSLVLQFAAVDRRIRLVATGGIGRGRALNRALAEATADLVANIDADDESHPCRLRYQLEAMKQRQEFAIVSTDWVRIGDDADPVWPAIDALAPATVADVTDALVVNNPVCHSSAMMRRAAILGLGGYSEGQRFAFDYDLWVRSAAAGLRIGRIQLPLAAKRIHAGQHYLHADRLRYILKGAYLQLRAMRALG